MSVIETKFRIGQEVYFYNPQDSQILKGKVSSISLLITENLPQVQEAYSLKPLDMDNNPMMFSTSFIPSKWVFNDKDDVIDFCCELMKSIEEL